ncbi:FAD-binding oxidoreductase [Acidipila sp. EB88]|uniref:NAD(P)/FAD-dependent oxidoreductase n=1 Tax=Acidipila sp. EB88 TaxID=2305226 RepID=UPI000F5EEFF1|nr:FAD-dependent oxidoreductase [Acidipila sp. EB88]RRA49363.1 FAD-binding oxidoreductase [Acidipila sp. EB88]
MHRYDLIIVGAGIIGAAVARECARSGLRVAIVEAGTPGGGITAAGMGHVVVMDDSPAQLALTAFSRGLWREESFPVSVEYASPGTIWIAADEEEMAEVFTKKETYARAGVHSQVLSAPALAALEPNLRAGLAGGLLVPEDGVMYPPAAAAYFLRQAKEWGAEMIAGRAARAGEGSVSLDGGLRLTARFVLLATGMDCALLPAMPLRMRKGHLVITDRYPGFVSHQLVELGYLKSAHKVAGDSVAFNVQPRQTGQLLIGSSRQYGSDTVAINQEILTRMLQRAEHYMPGLGAVSALRIWTGFRAATEDKLPLLGPAEGLSDDPTLWLAVGFEGLGYTHAPGAARLLADRLLGRASAMELEPFLPARLKGSAAGKALHA